MQFDKRLVVGPGQFHLFEFSTETRLTANFIERATAFVSQFSRRICRKSPRQQPAPEATDAKACRLFRRENKQLNRMLWTKSTLPQRPYRFQASQDSHNAVEFPCVRNRVDVRTRAHDRLHRIRAVPASESVSDGILMHREPCLLATRFHPRASFEIRRRENDSGHRGSFRVRE